MNTDSEIDPLIETLQNSPSVDQLQSVLLKLSKLFGSPVQELKVVLVLLDCTIPQIFDLLDANLQSQVVHLIKSIRGLGSLMSKLQLLFKAKSSHKLLQTYIKVLVAVFDDELLCSLRAKSALEVNEIDTLLFKGRALGVFNEAVELSGSGDSFEFASIDAYVAYLSNQLKKTELPSASFNRYFISLLGLTESSYLFVFDEFFNEVSWTSLLVYLKQMKSFQKKSFFWKFLQFLSKRKVLEGESYEKVDACASILTPVIEDSYFDKNTVESALRLDDKNISTLVGLVSSQKSQLFESTFQNWTSPLFIKSEPLGLQETRTHFLIQLLYLQPASFSSQLITKPSFLQGISNRLGSYSTAVRVFAVILADKACEIGNVSKIFSISNLEGYDYLLQDSSYQKRLQRHAAKTCWEIVQAPIVSTDTESIKDLSTAISKLDFTKTYKDSDDESTGDSDDEDDDPSIGQRIKLSSPIYIKELLSYLSVDTKHPQAYDMIKLALTQGPTLIRQKSHFGVEVSSNAVQLLQTLVGLQDQFNEPKFEDLKLNCIIAVLVGCPESALDISKMLGTGDYSLQQRMMILTGLSLAAREIRGFKDEIVTKSYKEKVFPTKRLAPRLHAKYLALDYIKQGRIEYEPEGLKRAHLSIQNSLILEDSQEAADQLQGGKILRISRNMRPKQSQNILTPKYDNYSTLISKYFYFPLTHLWYESGGINIGHYSGLLIGHYVKTMALLLHCSFASLTNNDMIREFLLIATDIAKTSTAEQTQVIEGVITGMLLITDISDEEHLVINFSSNLLSIQSWLIGLWEAIIDEQIKSLCAGFLLRLSKILDKYQATIMDQLNNVY
ncbi:hypothetical protein CANTEDRAFT_101927 [Yamadazyma tenuis ATCC 10573]|uniref:Telomere length regulation protein conserved domain-containing protein n=1 Tax=Candida tenuis (strain ATCC 10573 / BCRC 21748 / CBS 615 / JCM 9827 / NBRC 10315 / NRRL Y-1498 / VKM Y-70) TaxID=590646 RepID=G3AZK5_CANTC|nr:uncharacterized protein CANTEDRAFT_101927 [Yamadazyma tenuis ATCC 10573]EGV65605.1 hypothetical protein CANTEDRAFT_101927 [Yamadazyma tenuis ATCC 10573]